MRQPPQRILAAHRMDPARRELYVEGPGDRAFLGWLVGDQKSPDARIIEVRLVELPTGITGGEKGRLIAFASEMEGAGAQIKVFADADTDRILEKSVPSNVWLTDKRDLEGYILRPECIEKVIRLGHLNDRVNADDVLQRVTSLGRELGILRLVSEVDERNLPFQRTELRRHVRINDNDVHFNFDGYVTALLNNAGEGRKQLSEIAARHQELAEDYSSLDDAQLIHGKDAVVVLKRLLRANGLQSEDTGRLLRSTYERKWIKGNPSLEQVYEFLTGQ